MEEQKLPKCPTWNYLRNVRDTYAYLTRWPEEMRRTVALALAVAHWSPEARRGYNDKGIGRKRRGFFGDRAFPHHGCALCQVYNADNTCAKCPLTEVGDCCEGTDGAGNLRSSWYDVHVTIDHHGSWDLKGSFHDAADKLYWKLVELYRVEWEKL